MMAKYSKKEYNEEPVYYCTSCLNLNIKTIDGLNLTVCQDCGNTSIEETDIDTWNMLYIEEYGKSFISEDDIDDMTNDFGLIDDSEMIDE